MKTNLSVWISTAVVLTISAIALVSQRSSISATRSEIETIERAIAARQVPAPEEARPSHAVARAGSVPGRPSPSELLAMLADDERDVTSFFRSIPTMFEQIRDYSSDELLGLIAELDKLRGEDKSKDGEVGTVKALLMVILAEDVPERILEMIERDGGGSGGEIRAAAFAGLAKKDPQRAIELLNTADWPAHQVQNARAVVFRELLEGHLPLALDLFRDTQSDLLATASSAISDASSDPALRKQLWAAAASESDPVLRQEMAKGLITGEFIRGGSAAMRKALSGADFFDAKLKAVLINEFAGDAMASQPEQTAAWIRESLPAEEVPQALAVALGTWAQEDFNAAGSWLGTQESSPERDAAIGTFAKTVVAIDPIAAATWAASIEDEATRKSALELTITQWSQQDSDAATAWAKENGVDVIGIPGVLRAVEE